MPAKTLTGAPCVCVHVGEYVITFPKAYHGGFSLGYNVGEAVNFAMMDWLSVGRLCRNRYRRDNRDPVIAHDKLVFALGAIDLVNIKSPRDLNVLLQELIILRSEESNDRQLVKNNGICYSRRMPSEDLKSDVNDYERKCVVCSHPCSFSGIVCYCQPNKIVCLKHVNDLCECRNNEKCLVFLEVHQGV